MVEWATQVLCRQVAVAAMQPRPRRLALVLLHMLALRHRVAVVAMQPRPNVEQAQRLNLVHHLRHGGAVELLHGPQRIRRDRRRDQRHLRGIWQWMQQVLLTVVIRTNLA